MRGWVASVVMVAACGGDSKPPVSSSIQAGADPALPAHYAALFRKGEAWTYTFAVAYRDDEDPRHDANGRVAVKTTVKCTVADVRTLEAGTLASDISCAPKVAEYRNATLGNPIEGTWLATVGGLRRGSKGARTADLQAPVVAANPIAGQQGAATVVRTKTAWCVTVQGAGEGPGTSDELCFGDIGIESGMSDFRPGSEHDVERVDFSIQRE